MTAVLIEPETQTKDFEFFEDQFNCSFCKDKPGIYVFDVKFYGGHEHTIRMCQECHDFCDDDSPMLTLHITIMPCGCELYLKPPNKIMKYKVI